MKNTLVDLQNHIFEKIELLGDDKLQGDEAKLEIAKSMALSSLAKDAIANAALMAKAADHRETLTGLPILPENKPVIADKRRIT